MNEKRFQSPTGGGRSSSPAYPSVSTLNRSSSWMATTKSSYLYSTIFGLLSSSCCLVQLVLNFFSIGCAGFSILTPFRPIFVLITLFSMGYIYLRDRQRPTLRKTWIPILIAGLLMISPELVGWDNKSGFSSSSSSVTNPPAPFGNSGGAAGGGGGVGGLWEGRKPVDDEQALRRHQYLVKGQQEWLSTHQDSVADFALVPPSLASLQSPAVLPSDPNMIITMYKVSIQGMSCEACANRIKNAFQKMEGVEKVGVDFVNKEMVVYVNHGQLVSDFQQDSDLKVKGWTGNEIEQWLKKIDEKYSAVLESVLRQGGADPRNTHGRNERHGSDGSDDWKW